MSRGRGQTLTLMALTMLVVCVMIFMTLSVGSRVRRKLELHNTADAAAYSTAVATARAMNSVALLNRVSASHWVALIGIQADHAYGTMMPAYVEACAAGAYFLSTAPLACNADIRGQQMLSKARQLFWHAELAQWNAVGAEVQDPIEFPQGVPASQKIIRRLPIGTSLGELDRKVGAEQRQVWFALNDIAMVERTVHDRLRTALEGPASLSTRIALGTQGLTAGSTFPVTIEQPKDALGRTPPWREYDESVGTAWRDQMQLANAALGSRNSHFPVGGPMDWPNSDRGHYELPPRVKPQIAKIENYLRGAFGGKSIRCSPAPEYLLSTYFYRPTQTPAPNQGLPPSTANQYMRVGPADINGTEVLIGQIDATVFVSYASACGNRRIDIPVESTSIAFTNPDYFNGTLTPNATTAHYWGPCMNCRGSGIGSNIWANFWGRIYDEGEDPNVAGYYPEPPTHRYWLDPNEAIAHKLGNEFAPGTSMGVMPGGLGFVFPQKAASYPYGPPRSGAGGAFGQPKTPVLLTRALSGPGVTRDPWELNFGFTFSGGAGETIDLQAGSFQGSMAVQERTMAALSNGIAYYHRRRDTVDPYSWKEAPNLLNPYWHATLVPLDIDERGGAVDQTPWPLTPPGPANQDAAQMLGSVGLVADQQLYLMLKSNGYKGIQ